MFHVEQLGRVVCGRGELFHVEQLLTGGRRVSGNRRARTMFHVEQLRRAEGMGVILGIALRRAIRSELLYFALNGDK